MLCKTSIKPTLKTPFFSTFATMNTANNIVPTDKIIIGIDPGTTVMGYGVIAIEGKQIRLLQYGVIHLSKYSTHALKLKKIYERTVQLLDEFIPDEMAIEAQFFGKNVQSMLKLGRAQGVAIAAAMSREVPVVEYAPKKIKQSVTGNGNASKEQVAAMLRSMLKFDNTDQLLDATDALGVAVCHYFQNPATTQAKPKDWASFVNANKDRVKK